MQAPDVNRHALQDEGGAFSHRLIPPLGKLVQELLVTEDGMGRARRSEILLEKNRLTQRLILAPANQLAVRHEIQSRCAAEASFAMAIQYGINMFLWSASFGQDEFARLDAVRQFGFDGVEIPIFDPGRFDASLIRRELQQRQLACTVCTVVPPGLSLITAEPEVRNRTLAHLSACIEKTAELGVSILAGPLYHPVGSFSGVRRTRDEWCNAVAGFQALGPVLERTGVQLAIEPLNRFETYFLNTTEDGVRLCDEIAHPQIGLLWDTFHANIEEKHLGPALLHAGLYLKHVHTCENDRGAPGSGHVDWDAVFNALRELRYQGWLTIESFGFSIGAISAAASIWRDLAATPEVIATDGLRFLKRRAAAVRLS